MLLVTVSYPEGTLPTITYPEGEWQDVVALLGRRDVTSVTLRYNTDVQLEFTKKEEEDAQSSGQAVPEL